MLPEAVAPTVGLPGQTRSLRRNVFSTLLGNGFYSATQWAVTIVLARLGSPEMVGQFALGLAVSVPIFAATSFQLRAIQATDARDTHGISDFLGLRVLGTAIGMLVVAASALLSPWSRLTTLVVFIIGVRAAVETFSDVIYGYFQKHERMDLIARAMSARGATGLLTLALVLLATKSLPVALSCMTVAWLGWMVFYEWRTLTGMLRRSGAPTPWFSFGADSLVRIRGLMVLSLPLTVVLFLLSSSQSIPRLFLQSYAGERELGFFSAVAVLSGGIAIVYMAVGQAIMPRLAKMYIEDLARYRKLLAQTLLLAGGMGIMLVGGAHLVGPAILSLVYGPAYVGYGDVFTGLVLAAAINNICVLLGTAVTASRSFVPQLYASAVTTAAAVGSAAWLIPQQGLTGAVYCVLVTGTVQMMAYGYLCRRVATAPGRSEPGIEGG